MVLGILCVLPASSSIPRLIRPSRTVPKQPAPIKLAFDGEQYQHPQCDAFSSAYRHRRNVLVPISIWFLGKIIYDEATCVLLAHVGSTCMRFVIGIKADTRPDWVAPLGIICDHGYQRHQSGGQ